MCLVLFCSLAADGASLLVSAALEDEDEEEDDDEDPHEDGHDDEALLGLLLVLVLDDRVRLGDLLSLLLRKKNLDVVGSSQRL